MKIKETKAGSKKKEKKKSTSAVKRKLSKRSVIKNPKKLNQKMKKLSLKEEESAEDDDEDILSDKEFDSLDDDDVFFETKLENKSKQEVSLNLREFSKHLPINSTSLKTRGERAINLKFCCSINYFLYSLWSSAKLNPNFF